MMSIRCLYYQIWTDGYGGSIVNFEQANVGWVNASKKAFQSTWNSASEAEKTFQVPYHNVRRWNVNRITFTKTSFVSNLY